MTPRAAIDDFLAQNRFVFIGVSRNARHFSRTVFREMAAHGYRLVPVNPEADEIEGARAFTDVRDVDGDIDGALLMTPATETLAAVEACAERGITRVWLHRGLGGPGSTDPAAVTFCRERGISVVDGQCPLMFVGKPGWIHRLHAWGKRRRGTFPGA